MQHEAHDAQKVTANLVADDNPAVVSGCLRDLILGDAALACRKNEVRIS